MILGRTGSGKSFLLNFLITNMQKYDPYTFIFDLGGSFESLTLEYKPQDVEAKYFLTQFCQLYYRRNR